MCVDTKEEALNAVAEQHRRAKTGQHNGPQELLAERVVGVYFYASHPDDYNSGDSLTVDELKKVLPKLAEELADENGVVSVGALASEVRALSHPMKKVAGAHESKFKMEEEDYTSAEEIDTLADGIGS